MVLRSWEPAPSHRTHSLITLLTPWFTDSNPVMPTIYPPYVIERSQRGERSYDVFSRLLMDRIVFLGTPINDDVANIIIAQLLFLDADNPERDIHIYINSPGGSVSAGLAIYEWVWRRAWAHSSLPPVRRASGLRYLTRGS